MPAHPFDDVIEHMAGGGQARLGWLIYARFGDGDMRAWPGIGDITTGGYTWMGTGGTVEIKDLNVEQGFMANKLEITLSGVDVAFQTRAEASKDLVQNRPISIYLQAFDDAWQVLGDPIAAWAGIMDRMNYSGDVESARISLSCETPFATRNRPRASYYTHADQQQESPGDMGLEFTAILENKNVDQPVIS